MGWVWSIARMTVLGPSNVREKISTIQRGWRRQMDIRAALKELCEAFNAHDLDRIMAFFSDDCSLEMPRGNKP